MTNRLAGFVLVCGAILLTGSLAVLAIYLEAQWVTFAGVAVGTVLVLVGIAGLRQEIATSFNRRRRGIALFMIGAVGLVIALIHLSHRFVYRFDMTAAGLNSLSPQSVSMLKGLDKPVDIVFFHDALMRETVERYQMFARESELISLEFHDPTIEPARARLFGVQFPGTAVMRSEDRTLQVHGGNEVDIANGILRVSRGATQLVCFLDGHGEADPFSQESHDHMEATAAHDHSHGLGAEYVLHEQHGMAKARHSLETLNFRVEKLSLLKNPQGLEACTVLVVAGPKRPLLEAEVERVSAYLANGGHAMLLLDPFVDTGLEPILRRYGVVLDDAIVIDNASHYWTDVSAPAVTDYNNHSVTRGVPLSFYPGARSLSPTPERIPGTRVVPLINSSTNSFGETAPDRAEFDPDRDLPGPRTLMVVASRRPLKPGDVALQLDLQQQSAGARELDEMPLVTALSRIAVFGDSDFATNSFFHILGNGEIFLNALSYLAGEENLIGIEPRTHDLPRLSVTNRQIKTTFILSVLFAPFALGLVGTVVWWRQR